MRRRRQAALTVAALGIGLLAGCASDSPDDAAASAPACPLTIVDPWVKASDAEMTAAFGSVRNSGGTEVIVTEASSPAAGRMEIHEVVDRDGTMVMQPKQGGLAVPAGGSATLAPGADHLMLMELPAPVEAGDDVVITLTCSTGGTVTFTAVAKPFEGGAETYVPGSAAPSTSMPMSPSPSTT